MRVRTLLFAIPLLLSLPVYAAVADTDVPRATKSPPVAFYAGPTSRIDWAEVARQHDVQLVAWFTWAAAQPEPKKPATNPTRARIEGVSYNGDGIETIVCSVFGDNCARALRIARCESGLDPSARNRSGASGLFQLLGHGAMFEAHGWSADDWADPYKNTVVAFDLSRGGTDFSAWVCR